MSALLKKMREERPPVVHRRTTTGPVPEPPPSPEPEKPEIPPAPETGDGIKPARHRAHFTITITQEDLNKMDDQEFDEAWLVFAKVLRRRHRGH